MSAATLARLAQELSSREVRFVLIGLWGVNVHAGSGATIFATRDWDLFVPDDASTVLRAWEACAALGLPLWSGDEPRDRPRDLALARTVAERRALIRASDASGFDVDLTLVMSGFDFETVWAARRVFRIEGVEVPVARLRHIVESKAAAGRPKDRLFLATHAEALRALLAKD